MALGREGSKHSPALCFPLIVFQALLLLWGSGPLFPLCAPLPPPPQEPEHGGREQSARGCFMWIQELNLALACVLARLPREQKGNAARAASSTIV